MTRDVVVIGGGVSGLSCAHELTQKGYDVTVLERQVTPGGNATSSRFDGFLMEHGPTTFNAAFPNAMARASALGLLDSGEKLGPNVKKRYLRDGRGLHGIPVSPLGFFTSNYLSVSERVSMAAEILRPRKSGNDEETTHQFATRRFGRGFADKVLEPMTAGIFMGNSKSLSVSGAFPKLVELEKKFGSITRGVLAAKRGSEPGRLMLSWKDGIATLPRVLAGQLGSKIQTGVTVTNIDKTGDGFKITTANHGAIHSLAVVLAVQPHVAAMLLEQIDPIGAASAHQITAPPIAVAFLGYHRDQIEHPLDGLGFLATNSPDHVISGAQFCSTMFTERAPQDHVAISCYVGGQRNPELAALPAKELTAIVQQELAPLFGIKGQPVVSRVHHWARGLPQYTLGHASRREVVETTNQRVPGLFLTGNYIGGVSVANCLETASDTALKVAQSLEQVAPDQGAIWDRSLDRSERKSRG